MTVEFIVGYYLGRKVELVDLSPQGTEWVVGRFADEVKLRTFWATQVKEEPWGDQPLDMSPLR